MWRGKRIIYLKIIIIINPSLPIDLKKEPDGDSTPQDHNDMQKEPTDSLYQVPRVMYRKKQKSDKTGVACITHKKRPWLHTLFV
jgi:hypothetical protein